MLSTLDEKQHDPHDVIEISPDVVMAARTAADFPAVAPEVAARRVEREIQMGPPGGALPRVDTFRATDTSGEGRSGGRWLRRSVMAFMFALCSAFAAGAWERYGDDARAMLADLTPQGSLTAWLPTSLISGRPAVAAQADQAAVAPPGAADQTAPNAQTDAAAPAPTAPSSDTAQLLQSMARDVASLNQQLGELKTRIAELKAGQEQLGRDMAKAPEPKVAEARPIEPRPAKLGAPPRPLGAMVAPAPHRPKPPAPAAYPQAAYVPPPPPPSNAPVQIAPSAQVDTDQVVRPPMPVR